VFFLSLFWLKKESEMAVRLIGYGFGAVYGNQQVRSAQFRM
jgi:hypothetical protein